MANRNLSPEAAVDLHLHTRASDGGWTPETLITYLREHQFQVAAVADHDTMASVPAARSIGEDAGIDIVPAVEMTTRWEDRHVHCLIYGIYSERPEARVFMELLAEQQHQLDVTARRIVDLLERNGRRVPSLAEVADGRPLKPYLVYFAMIKDGHGRDPRTAHNIVKGLGEPGLVDVPLDQTVAAAHEAGALAVVAHPGRDDGWGILKADKLDRMRTTIPIDGIEAHYRSYKDDEVAMYRGYAAEHDILASAGSDSHRPGYPVDPIPYHAAWIAPLLRQLGYEVEVPEGADWRPREPATV